MKVILKNLELRKAVKIKSYRYYIIKQQSFYCLAIWDCHFLWINLLCVLARSQKSNAQQYICGSLVRSEYHRECCFLIRIDWPVSRYYNFPLNTKLFLPW
jgi:hypothetical protein